MPAGQGSASKSEWSGSGSAVDRQPGGAQHGEEALRARRCRRAASSGRPRSAASAPRCVACAVPPAGQRPRRAGVRCASAPGSGVLGARRVVEHQRRRGGDAAAAAARAAGRPAAARPLPMPRSSNTQISHVARQRVVLQAVVADDQRRPPGGAASSARAALQRGRRPTQTGAPVRAGSAAVRRRPRPAGVVGVTASDAGAAAAVAARDDARALAGARSSVDHGDHDRCLAGAADDQVADDDHRHRQLCRCAAGQRGRPARAAPASAVSAATAATAARPAAAPRRAPGAAADARPARSPRPARAAARGSASAAAGGVWVAKVSRGRPARRAASSTLITDWCAASASAETMTTLSSARLGGGAQRGGQLLDARGRRTACG